jgi:uncharacterized membrane protein required for colicin V production
VLTEFHGGEDEVWPNWIDLIIVTLVWAACYAGFGRGILAELLNLVGAVVVTIVTVHGASAVALWVKRYGPMGEALIELLAFWVVFFVVWSAMRILRSRIAEVLQWNRPHWLTQGLGLVAGGVRGVWWAGFIVLVLSSSGFGFLHQSVSQGSVFGPRLLSVFQTGLTELSGRFPGAPPPDARLVPSVRAAFGAGVGAQAK